MRAPPRCSGCGIELVEDPPDSPRSPCPQCGATARTFSEEITLAVKARERIDAAAKHPSSKKPFWESRSGDDLHRKTGRWMKTKRLIDREENRYEERIEDPETGKVIRDVAEPLSEHRGHGSARPKPSGGDNPGRRPPPKGKKGAASPK